MYYVNFAYVFQLYSYALSWSHGNECHSNAGHVGGHFLWSCLSSFCVVWSISEVRERNGKLTLSKLSVWFHGFSQLKDLVFFQRDHRIFQSILALRVARPSLTVSKHSKDTILNSDRKASMLVGEERKNCEHLGFKTKPHLNQSIMEKK